MEKHRFVRIVLCVERQRNHDRPRFLRWRSTSNGVGMNSRAKHCIFNRAESTSQIMAIQQTWEQRRSTNIRSVHARGKTCAGFSSRACTTAIHQDDGSARRRSIFEREV